MSWLEVFPQTTMPVLDNVFCLYAVADRNTTSLTNVKGVVWALTDLTGQIQTATM